MSDCVDDPISPQRQKYSVLAILTSILASTEPRPPTTPRRHQKVALLKCYVTRTAVPRAAHRANELKSHGTTRPTINAVFAAEPPAPRSTLLQQHPFADLR